MAGAHQVRSMMAEVSGSNPSTIDRMLRTLLTAGLVPKGTPGRGQANGQFEAAHLVNVLFGFAGHQPSDAAEAAEILGGLQHRWMYLAGNPEGQQVEEPCPTLHENLTKLVDGIGRWMLEQRTAASAAPQPHYPTGILLNLHLPRAADVMWVGRRDVYVPRGGYSSQGDVGRQTSLGPHMIHAAGRLWADTLARRGGLLFPPSSAPTTSAGDKGGDDGNSSAGAMPKTENGADGALPGATATPSNTRVQPRANGTSSFDSTENRETEAKPQALSSGAWLDTPPHMSMSRHRRPGVSPCVPRPPTT